jgi:alpha-ketoglutarate-dependent taurine dioxygenase
MLKKSLLDGPEVWNDADARARTGWQFALESDACAQMVAALDGVDCSAPQLAGREYIALGALQSMFADIRTAVEHGAGFAHLSGLPFTELSYAQRVALTLALADHIGDVVVQNYEGQRVVDVRDEGIPYSHESRGYRSNKHLPFHTDGANLFSLTCLDAAASGGETIIVSASAVYNTLASECPDALPILMRGFYHHRRGQHHDWEPPLSTHRVPVFAFHNDLLHCCYNRNPIDWARHEGIELDAAEVAALDAMDAIMARREMQLRLELQPGESLIVNNFTTLHSRTEYVDDDLHRRHMLRVWMQSPSSQRAGFSLLDLYVPAELRA